MTTFIKLHIKHSSKVFYVNPDCITCLREGPEGTCVALIGEDEDEPYKVLETPEQILKILADASAETELRQPSK
jgi:hypothetical protein